jgi:hypothetical protein
MHVSMASNATAASELPRSAVVHPTVEAAIAASEWQISAGGHPAGGAVMASAASNIRRQVFRCCASCNAGGPCSHPALQRRDGAAMVAGWAHARPEAKHIVFS